MFSGAVKLGDLDDYLGPAQDCVVELFQEDGKVGGDTTNDNHEVRVRNFDLSEISAEILKGDKPDLIKKSKDGDGAAKVSLYDCLACSGCVTTAEVMLLDAQSISFFKEMIIAKVHQTKLSLNGRNGPTLRSVKKLVVTICHASLSALAVHYNISNETTMLNKIRGYLYSRGIDLVMTQALGDAAVLMQQKIEQINNPNKSKITSHCPGWVCFAEKTCSPTVLDDITKNPTAMIIQGKIIKDSLMVSNKIGCLKSPLTQYPGFCHLKSNPFLKAEEICHVSIMSCYDKKLESLRPEFQIDLGNGHSYPLVDLVLGTNEFLDWITSGGFDINCDYSLCSGDLWRAPFYLINQWNMMMGSKSIDYNPFSYYLPFLNFSLSDDSGGMANYASFDNTSPLSLSYGMNKDFRIISQIHSLPNGKIKSKVTGSLPYGLRNLNNLALISEKNQLSSLGRTIEAMACPSGCILGGAHAGMAEENHLGEPYRLKELYKKTIVETRTMNRRHTCSPFQFPELIIWNNYLKNVNMKHGNLLPVNYVPDGMGHAVWWLYCEVPQFKYLSLKDSPSAQATDLNW